MSATHSLKLLIVEDHTALRAMLSETLEALGYHVEAFESAELALEQWHQSADIALLDVNLPGEDGLYLAQQLRLDRPNLGVIVMSVRNQIGDKIAGYDAGADIYLPKPIDPDELNAAIQALARRIPQASHSDLVLEHMTLQLTNQAQDSVTLSNDECRLLMALSQAPERQQEYWELAEKLDLDLDSDTLRSNLEKRISRLRKKLTQLQQPSTAIKTLRNKGYQLTIAVKVA